jgi:hypothetical protein
MIWGNPIWTSPRFDPAFWGIIDRDNQHIMPKGGDCNGVNPPFEGSIAQREMPWIVQIRDWPYLRRISTLETVMSVPEPEVFWFQGFEPPIALLGSGVFCLRKNLFMHIEGGAWSEC